MAYIDSVLARIEMNRLYEVKLTSFTKFSHESVLDIMYRSKYGIKSPIRITIWQDGTVTSCSSQCIPGIAISLYDDIKYKEIEPKSFNIEASTQDVLDYIYELAKEIDDTYEKVFKWMKENKMSYDKVQRLMKNEEEEAGKQ